MLSFPVHDTLRDLVQFEQFKKREKHPWSSATFSKVAGWSLKVLHVFLNCANDTKSPTASHIFLIFG